MIDGLVAQAGQRGARPRRETAAAADDLRRGDGALRPRRARLALRHGTGRHAPIWRKEAEFRVFRGAADGGGRVRGINAKGAAAKYSRKDIDELTADIVPGFRREGPGLVQGRGRRHAGLADRQEFHAGAAGENRAADEGRAGRLAAVRRRHVRGHVQGAVRAAQAARRGAEALRSGDDALFLDRRVSDVRLRRRREMLGRDAPSVHRAAAAGYGAAGDRSGQVPRAGLRPGDQRLAKRAAARSEFTIRQMQQQVFDAAGHRPANRPASGSASCSTRCNSAPRRTAASRWASTAG